MLPHVSVPSAARHISVATATALPPDEPPEIRSRSWGLRTGQKQECSFDQPMANSSIFVFPTIHHPATSMFSNTVLLYPGVNHCNIWEQQVVSYHLVMKISFTPIGAPARGRDEKSSICISIYGSCTLTKALYWSPAFIFCIYSWSVFLGSILHARTPAIYSTKVNDIPNS